MIAMPSHASVPVLAQTVPVIYIDPDGIEKEVQAEVGKHLLDVAHDNDIELEGTNVTCCLVRGNECILILQA
jgi:hypothetical protein